MTDPINNTVRAHEWIDRGYGFPVCGVCGMVRRGDAVTKCKGPVKMRELEKPLVITNE